ncbi:hypothetical protein VPHG_00031 [Vibrio phage 11895-B1]|uniref:hypothetical protein n=1 Tax=Vibrio phage 11895-B1 TaxID=754075 RepID=UPI0002C134D4|nr:hypothetical protein VPHG_00031 [Vibrio phage 11895-B1]AGH32098.1 hypothetical protein VPHG_00031 [Vibrio phage 11895-B1]
MLNTYTMCQLYEEFCNESGSVPTKPSVDGFINLVCGGNTIFFNIFVAYLVMKGYDVRQLEEYEDDTFNGNAKVSL